MANNNNSLVHWSDTTADRIIRQLGERDRYTLACGITPSGTVHFGNFRETITTDLVARALRARGKNVRLIFSWDDFDTFRKVPKGMPQPEALEKCLFTPIVDTPDPFGKEESYARYHQKAFEAELTQVGVEVEYLYQSKKYRNGDYQKMIKQILSKREEIVAILNQHRTSDLAADWMPISIYCQQCNRDNKIEQIKFDGEDDITYRCGHCQQDFSIQLSTTDKIKLPWRIDWPMRWEYEQVDFEPGGKDHSSQGGSYSTAKELVQKLFNRPAPIYLQYDFVSFKGAGGKMSSSAGGVITVSDVLKIYSAEMVRWIFASYKTNVDFAVSFDLDVIKSYEDFDKMERLAWGDESGNPKKVAMANRVYQLSQVDPNGKRERRPFRPPFRHLCNILQINNGDLDRAQEYYAAEIRDDQDIQSFTKRAECAKHWIDNFAPEDFKYQLNRTPIQIDLEDKERAFLDKMSSLLTSDWDEIKSDKDLHERIYLLVHQVEIDPKAAFTLLYRLLINREQGPKLASFIRIIGATRVIELIRV